MDGSFYTTLTVCYESGNKRDDSAICIMRHNGNKSEILKMEIGIQADILYYLLTKQEAKAEIREATNGKDNN